MDGQIETNGNNMILGFYDKDNGIRREQTLSH